MYANTFLTNFNKNLFDYYFLFFCRYFNEPIEDHVKFNFESYDAVVTSEVLEHVSNKHSFLTNCVECLKVVVIIIIF